MKKTFWNKKASEMTAGETMKFVVWLMVGMYAVVYGFLGIVLFWAKIYDFFKNLKGKICRKFFPKSPWYEREEEELE